MKESLLQFIWNQKRFNHSNLRLFDERELIIKNYGQFNINENGPDFLNAQIIIDSIMWVGNIEIHVRSSDWMKHGHHKDSNYNNVILHVVWENDVDIQLFDKNIPVLELKNYVHTSVLANYSCFQRTIGQIPCKRFIQSIDILFKQEMMDRALLKRLERKSSSFRQFDTSQQLYVQLARAMGGKTNQDSFEFISEKLPFSLVSEMKTQQRTFAFNTMKELMENQRNSTAFEIPVFKTKGMRPASQHSIRLKQFIQLIPLVRDFNILVELSTKELIFLYRKKMSQYDSSISFEIQNSILINVFVPYLFSLDDERYVEKAIEILENLPKEKNNVVQKMINFGFSVNNSFQSQAVLEIYTQFCLKKYCLKCSIGAKILNS
jgi:hypothetical protein